MRFGLNTSVAIIAVGEHLVAVSAGREGVAKKCFPEIWMEDLSWELWETKKKATSVQPEKINTVCAV